ncbi:sodium:solute symporter family protein [Bacteroides sp. 51]|uniref:sodium:solute symporter family protein n=1 Tax=Bacteroides sp. 51 TaxID=2302938 RepID=UPI0013D1BEC3|nr:sodium:solute symporter family protein [Bacteroides sp. 51]NDV81715.1 sodium transporter [Bacteroides sp. 51]
MSTLDFITIIVFAIGIVSVGLSFSGKKNMKSFFAAGGAVPWQMNGLSLFMGFFSAGTFVVWGSIAYSLGWVSVSIQWTMAIAGLLVGSFIAPRWNKTGVLTAAEYITHRLGVRTQKTFTYLFLFISLFTTGSFLYPIAKIIEVSTGIPLNACILLIGGFCILYVAVGGLWAVVSTDVLQFVILTAAVIIVIPMSFDRVGNVTEFIQSAPDAFFNLTNGEYTWPFLIAFGVYNAIFLGGNWAYVQRYTSVKNSTDSKKVGWLFGALYVISPVLWMLPPMVYRICNPTLDGLESEGAYLMMCKEVLPAGLLGLVLGGMIFATASSMNSALNISAGVVTNDIFKRLYPRSSDKRLMLVARLSTVLFGILAIVVALMVSSMGGIVNVVISVAALTGVPLYLPVIWTLFSRRQTSCSVLTTTLLSLGINAIFKFVTPMLFNFSLSRTEEMVLGVSFPILCLILFELYYKSKGKISSDYSSYKEWENANWAEKQQVFAETVEATNKQNDFSRKIIGYGICCTGIGIIILGAISATGKLLVISVGALLVIVGLFICRKRK